MVVVEPQSSHSGQEAFFFEDEVKGAGVHDFEFNLHLAPKRQARLISTQHGILCRILGDQQIEIAINAPASLQGSIEPTFLSRTYGSTVPALKVRVWGRGALPLCITTQISWTDVAHVKRSNTSNTNEAQLPDSMAEEARQT